MDDWEPSRRMWSAAKKFFDFMASDEGAQIWADGVQTISPYPKNNI